MDELQDLPLGADTGSVKDTRSERTKGSQMHTLDIASTVWTLFSCWTYLHACRPLTASELASVTVTKA